MTLKDDLSFDGWDFSNAATVDSVSLNLQEPSSFQKAARAYGGVSEEVTSGGLRILLSGTVNEASASNFLASKKALLTNTQGLLRNRHGRLALRSGFHYWCARAGGVSMAFEDGAYNARWSMEFIAGDPFERANSEISAAIVGTTGSVTHASDFFGDAPVMPIRLDAGGGWQAGEVFIIENTTTGTIFSKVVESTLASGETLIIDSPRGVCLEGDRISNVGIGGRFPFVQGSVTNSFDQSAASRTNILTFNFWDRYSPG